MTASRPHLSKTGPQLNELFEASKQDVKVLRQLLKELKRRTTPSARALVNAEVNLTHGGADDFLDYLQG
jgi:hypothetical protein